MNAASVEITILALMQQGHSRRMNWGKRPDDHTKRLEGSTESGILFSPDRGYVHTHQHFLEPTTRHAVSYWSPLGFGLMIPAVHCSYYFANLAGGPGLFLSISYGMDT